MLTAHGIRPPACAESVGRAHSVPPGNSALTCVHVCFFPLFFYIEQSAIMAFTNLEIVGLSAIVVVASFVLSELWKFLYTTRIGHALGKTISLKDIGQWAGKSFIIIHFIIFKEIPKLKKKVKILINFF